MTVPYEKMHAFSGKLVAQEQARGDDDARMLMKVDFGQDPEIVPDGHHIHAGVDATGRMHVFDVHMLAESTLCEDADDGAEGRADVLDALDDDARRLIAERELESVPIDRTQIARIMGALALLGADFDAWRELDRDVTVMWHDMALIVDRRAGRAAVQSKLMTAEADASIVKDVVDPLANGMDAEDAKRILLGQAENLSRLIDDPRYSQNVADALLGKAERLGVYEDAYSAIYGEVA